MHGAVISMELSFFPWSPPQPPKPRFHQTLFWLCDADISCENSISSILNRLRLSSETSLSCEGDEKEWLTGGNAGIHITILRNGPLRIATNAAPFQQD